MSNPAPPDDATRRQIEAADPARSTWLSANAGSGKTRVLTDRVARLLLAGTAPERILCLTYTKAAATEMQNRLLARLGEWAMLSDAALRSELAKLGQGDAPDLPAARRLFARAIETPGGLKVQTIHSFCAALLRRFPLEAGVPHQFTEMDDRTGRLARAEIVDRMVEEGAPEVADLLALHSGHELDKFLTAIAGNAPGFATPPDFAALLGLAPGDTPDRLAAEVLGGIDPRMWSELIPALLASGPRDSAAGAKLARGNWAAPGIAEVELLTGVLLYGEKAKDPFGPKIGSFPTNPLRENLAAWMDDLDALMQVVADNRDRLLALGYAGRCAALHRFARAFLARYEAVKTAQGWLDFDDLIRRAGALLSDASVAQWVLFRLDGGIDHILVDEAQDTSPAQWQVISSLTTEFTAGQGAGERNRSLFVVGDPKQSIYSFQGADVAVFEARRRAFAGAFRAAGNEMQDTALEYSFRSSLAVLDLVDASFAGEAGAGLGGPSLHKAFQAGKPGRVDLWPAVPEPESPEPADWRDPVDMPAPDAAQTRLARAIAGEIRRLIDAKTPIAGRDGPRPLTPGDFLILVQTRTGIFDDLIRECKAAGLPIAGADRLKLAGEIAVRDIRAVLEFLSTPEDDLSLAAALRSPLFGLSEDALYRLAAGRKGFLWEVVRENAPADVLDILHDLRDRSGFMRPYDLISRLLVRHDGRARLLARLGPEAEDGIEELLSQALAYERSETPSLTGFLVWLSGDEVEVKRTPGSGAGLVRVMTVHGSKGLEAPVVILPETHKRGAPRDSAILPVPDGPVMLRATKAARPAAAEGWVAQASARTGDERKRLLYVALTRAESWLIVAASGETGEGAESWYGMVADGFGRAGVTQAALQTPVGEGLRLSFGDWPAAAEDVAPPAPPAHRLPPEWRDRPAPVAEPPRPVAATALGGAKVIAGGPAQEDAMAAGTRLHLLLEHLPHLPRENWPEAARAALAGSELGLPEADTLSALLAEVEALISAQDLAGIFAPQGEVFREVELTAPLAELGGTVLHGTIDRLIVGENVLAVDYKTNAIVPEVPESVPDGILRQMAAYRAALRQIYPARRVETAILWTRDGSLMRLPDPLLDRALKGQGGAAPS